MTIVTPELATLANPLRHSYFLGMPAGRPSSYSEEIALRICEELSSGRSLRSIVAQDDMPAIATVYKWQRDFPEFLKQYARATEDRADAMFEEMFAIADDGVNDTYTTEDGRELVNHDVIARSKLRIDTRKWALARMSPKKYGEKMGLELAGQVSHEHTLDLGGLTDEQLRALAAIPLPKG